MPRCARYRHPHGKGHRQCCDASDVLGVEHGDFPLLRGPHQPGGGGSIVEAANPPGRRYQGLCDVVAAAVGLLIRRNEARPWQRGAAT
jgi:hypothetical protein